MKFTRCVRGRLGLESEFLELVVLSVMADSMFTMWSVSMLCHHSCLGLGLLGHLVFLPVILFLTGFLTMFYFYCYGP
jgi:hypothetical protein